MATLGSAHVEIPLYVKDFDGEFVEVGTITKQIEIVTGAAQTVYTDS